MRLHDRDEFFHEENHFNDHLTSLGYDYEKSILKNATSLEMYGNPMTDAPMRQIERMLSFLINLVKRIKLEYNFTLPKNSKDLN